MANVENANTIYVDSTGTLTSEKNVKLAYILYTSSAGGDTLTLRDKDGSGALKLTVRNNIATDSTIYDFSLRPVVFPNGIHVSTISAGSTATLVLTKGGQI